MAWYYVENGEQRGPIADADFEALASTGKVSDDTLVWREGQAGWLPWRDVRPNPSVSGLPPTPSPTPAPTALAPSAPMPGATRPAAPAPLAAAPVADVSGKVSGPAICLMVTAVIGLLLQIASVLMKVLGVNLAPTPATTDKNAALVQMFSGTVGTVFAAIGIVVGVVILFGAIKMNQRRNHGFAVTAAILAMIPCISPCCLLGLPIGIWALVVLLDAQVKASFES